MRCSARSSTDKKPYYLKRTIIASLCQLCNYHILTYLTSHDIHSSIPILNGGECWLQAICTKNCIMICNMGNGQLVKISSFLAVVLCWPGSRPKKFERNKWQEWETDIEVHGYAYLLQNIFYSNYMSSCPIHNTVSVMTCGLCVMSYMSKWNSPCNFIF